MARWRASRVHEVTTYGTLWLFRMMQIDLKGTRRTPAFGTLADRLEWPLSAEAWTTGSENVEGVFDDSFGADAL